MAGYSAPPATYDAMLFYLPTIATVTARVVELQDRKWELWSPNSSCHAYYPGYSSPDARLGTDLDSELRRSDGHLGRFDYSVNPQHFDELRPWLGFIKKRRNDSSPENVTLLEVWKPTSPPNYGEFHPPYLNQFSLLFERLLNRASELETPVEGRPDLVVQRPEYMTRDGTNSLRVVRTIDDAVDTLATVQRDVKELDAWNRMTEQLRLNRFETDAVSVIPAADDSLIGVWMNGCTEAKGTWLLHSKIPCFIVHEITKELDGEFATNHADLCYTMGARTSLSLHETSSRTLERCLLENGQTLEPKHEDLGIAIPGQGPRGMRCDRARSSTKGQGWENGKYRDPRASTLTAPPNEPKNQDENGLITPPAVHTVIPNKPWTNWVEELSDDGVSYLLYQSKSNKFKESRGEYEYFDRVNRRQLHLENPIDLPKNYNADYRVFGLPPPDFPFYIKDATGKLVSQPRSLWVYEGRDPRPGEAGKENVPTEVCGSVHSDDDDVISLGSEEDCDLSYRPKPINVDKDVEMSFAGGPLLSSELSVPRAATPLNLNDGMETQELSQDARSRTPYRHDGSRDARNYARHSHHYEGSRERDRGRSSERYERTWRRNDSYDKRPRPRRRSRSNSRYYSPSPKRQRNYRGDSPYPGNKSYRGRYSPPSPRFAYQSSSSRAYDNTSRHSNSYVPKEASPPRYRPRNFPPEREPTVEDRSLVQRRQKSEPMRYPVEEPILPVVPSSLMHRLQKPTLESVPAIESNSLVLRQRTDPVPRQFENPQLPVASTSTGLDLSHIDEQIRAMFPEPDASPVATLTYRKQGDTRFLIIWNLPVLYCWEGVLAWAFEAVDECKEIKLLQILRTNEAGHQIFWFAVKNEAQGRSFRGHVNTRKEDSEQRVLCDFVTEYEYSSAAGRSIDRWDRAKGLISSLEPGFIFNEEPSNRMICSSLAERLGISVLPMPFSKKSRGKKGGAKAKAKMSKRPTDGGAL